MEKDKLPVSTLFGFSWGASRGGDELEPLLQAHKEKIKTQKNEQTSSRRGKPLVVIGRSWIMRVGVASK
jgi:hypothetical protein